MNIKKGTINGATYIRGDLMIIDGNTAIDYDNSTTPIYGTTTTTTPIYINTTANTTTPIYINTTPIYTGTNTPIYTGTNTLIYTVTTTPIYTGTTGTTGNTGDIFYIDLAEYKKNILRNHIKQNLLIKSISRSLEKSFSPEEQRARDSLRDLLTEKDWRRYVTNGFIMVKGAYYWYQIFNKGNIQVYYKGKNTHSICIHTDRSCPPTDHVLNMKFLIEIDERQIWQGGNVYKGQVMTTLAFPTSGGRNLLELSKMLA